MTCAELKTKLTTEFDDQMWNDFSECLEQEAAEKEVTVDYYVEEFML